MLALFCLSLSLTVTMPHHLAARAMTRMVSSTMIKNQQELHHCFSCASKDVPTRTGTHPPPPLLIGDRLKLHASALQIQRNSDFRKDSEKEESKVTQVNAIVNAMCQAVKVSLSWTMAFWMRFHMVKKELFSEKSTDLTCKLFKIFLN